MLFIFSLIFYFGQIFWSSDLDSFAVFEEDIHGLCCSVEDIWVIAGELKNCLEEESGQCWYENRK